MKETRPLFIYRKFRSILLAAIVEEMVVYIVSITDTIVAGNVIDSLALQIVGLVAPITTFSLFVTSIINNGTIRNYSLYIGSFNRKRANQFFSQGVLIAIAGGVLTALVLFFLRESYISRLALNSNGAILTRSYYSVMLFYIVMDPVGCVLDNIIIAEGGEKYAAGANIIEISLNVVLSVIFATLWGVSGIAWASVLSKIVFLVICIAWLIINTNDLCLTWYWSIKDFFTIVSVGIVRASTFGFSAIMTVLLNAFVLNNFGNDTLVILIIVKQYLGLSSLFLGMATSTQTITGTLIGENNTKALREFMVTVVNVMLQIGIVVTTATLVFAPSLVRIFGMGGGKSFETAIRALRLSCSTLFIQGLVTLFFVYYYLTDHKVLAFIICILKDYILPLFLIQIFCRNIQEQNDIWAGLMLSPVITLLFAGTLVFLYFKKDKFPFIIPRDRDDHIHIYDFKLDENSIVEMSKTAKDVAKDYPVKLQNLLAVYVEDLLMLIKDKNQSSDKILEVEVTLMTLEEGVRLITRDSGILFDITDTDEMPESFREYIVASLIDTVDKKAHILTTGYNRNDFLFT